MVRLQRNDPLEIVGKRSRPMSSLDYAADRSESPKLVSNSRGQQPEQSEWKRNGGGNENSVRNMTPLTRSRGSSGIPKQPRTLADLEGMTQKEMAEALDNDPTLAEELKLATEQYQQQQQQRQQQQQQREAGDTRRSSGGSSKSSSFVKGGDRVTILKENGVPYQQWGILLLCLGVGLYQVYKAMKPPGSSGKTQKGSSKHKVKSSSAKRSKSQIDDAVIAELEGSVATAPHAATKRAKKKKSTKVEATKAPSSSPESAAVTPSTPKLRSKKQTPEPRTEIFFEEEVAEEGEWKTVGNVPVTKTTKTVEKPTTTTTAVVADDAITVHTSNTSKKKKKNGASAATKTSAANLVNDKVEFAPASNGSMTAKPASMMNGSSTVAAPVHRASSSPPQDEVVAPDETLVKKKKIKKKKTKEDVNSFSSETNGASHAAADAALAQQLQQEEDQLASDQAAAVLETNGTVRMEQTKEEDDWAEVTKKKKPVKALTTTEGETAATMAPTTESSATEEKSLSIAVDTDE